MADRDSGTARVGWLERSGQAWRILASNLVLAPCVVALILPYADPHRFAAAGVVVGLPAFLVAAFLRYSIRCRVCGLFPLSSATSRKLSAVQRRHWLRRLESCPVCDDDGRATPESRLRWVEAGSPTEKLYWSRSRLAIAAAIVVISACALWYWASWYYSRR